MHTITGNAWLDLLLGAIFGSLFAHIWCYYQRRNHKE